MKKFTIVAMTFGMFASSLAHGATTGEVSLSGTVSSTLAITVTPTEDASALGLDGAGSATEHIVKIADLAISTNNEQGFLLTVSSGNIAKSGGSAIAYQVTTVADGASAPATGAFLVASGESYTVSTTAAGAGNKDLYIKYTPATLQDPGNYAATVNLTVTDN
jgi:hypothetical protein